MSQFAIRRGNPPAEVLCNGNPITNLGPGTVFYADNQDVSQQLFEGVLLPGQTASLEGSQWFITDAARASLSIATVSADPDHDGAPGPRGPQGFDGAPGHDGSDGTGFHWRGAWAGSPTTYAVGDVVYKTADLNVITPLPTYIATATTPAAVPPSTGWDLMPISGPQGPAGAPGPLGPSGPPGTSGAAVTNAVVGQEDHFTSAFAGTLVNEGGSTYWVLENDANSRPQNIDSLLSDAEKLSVNYEGLQGRAIGSVVATPDEVLKLAGIEASVDASPTDADIRLFQNKRMSDYVYWDSTDNVWVGTKGIKSPWILTGLDHESADFSALIQAETGLQAHYRFDDASGATIVDSGGGSHNGALVGGTGGVTYAVAGGLPNDATNKAITLDGTSTTHSATFALMGLMDQTAFTVEWFGKVPTGGTAVFRDGTGTVGTGYSVGKQGTGEIVAHWGTVALITTTLWTAIEDGHFHHVVMTKSGTAGRLYLDNVLIGSISNAPTTALVSPWTVGLSGAAGSSVSSQAITMDELAFYNVALTAAQIDEHYYPIVADGVLTVSHDDVGDTDISSIVLTPRGSGAAATPVIRDDDAAVRATGFDVEFYDSDGDKLVAATSDMKLSIARTVTQRPINPQNFKAYRFIDPSAMSAAVGTDEPLTYFPLAEVAGSTSVVDVRASGAAGTVSSGVTLGETGLIIDETLTAAEFDGGANAKIGFPSPNLSNHEFAIELWFEITGGGTVGGNDYVTLLGYTAVSTNRLMVRQTTGLIYVGLGAPLMLSATGVVSNNVPHHLVYQWNKLTHSVWLDGVNVAQANVTSGLNFINPFYLGTWSATANAYWFKGSMQHFAMYDKALSPERILSHYASGIKETVKQDATIGTSISLMGLVETLAQAPENPGAQPLPVKTARPAGDIGGAAAHDCNLAAIRSKIYASDSWMKTPLPADVPGRNAILLDGYAGHAASTSANWVASLCRQMGFDPATPPSQLTPNYLPGYQIGQAWMDVGEYIYVVPHTQPRRSFVDTVGAIGAPVFNAVHNRLGGVPLPLDARPHGSADHYIGLIVLDAAGDPKELWTLYSCTPSQPAVTTMEFTGAPTAGSFTFNFFYMDNGLTAVNEYVCQGFCHYNATAAEVQALIQGAKSKVNGVALGATRPGSYGPSVIVTGGPLNVAPIVCTFPVCEPTYPVGMQITDSALNAGTVHFTYTNCGPYDQGRGCAVIVGSPDGHVPGLADFDGVYTDRSDLAGFQWQSHYWPATATHIDMYGSIPTNDELAAAKAAGTNLGHCLIMSVGHAQGNPFGYVFPASAGDGIDSTADGSFIPEGARITFPPDVDLSGVLPDMMPVAKTIRDYGIIPIDKSGFGCDCGKFQRLGQGYTVPSGRATTDYWQLYLTSGNASHLYNRCLPWHKAQIVMPSFSGP